MECEERQELYHEIFGSILDRAEMTPYLLRNCANYSVALARATSMMGNRGFDVGGGELPVSEKERAADYVDQATAYLRDSLFPFVEKHLGQLAATGSAQAGLYRESATAVRRLGRTLSDSGFAALVEADPRHLFLLASSAKYPNLFFGYREPPLRVPHQWRMMACAILKMCHLIKAVEEDSQDINDYARLGIYLESSGIGLSNLFSLDWHRPAAVPEDEGARRAFVKLSSFFNKLKRSISFDSDAGCLVFDSGDGVRVDIDEVMARLKSPESMFAKLGVDVDEEAYSIRDILAITFLLRDREDALTLFHALQKRGVILQENAVSTSITQTLFGSPADMEEAVRRLMLNLERSGGAAPLEPDRTEVSVNAEAFFRALSVNAVKNPHSADRHRKFQCKIRYSLPVHRDAATRRILIPGTETYERRCDTDIVTQQHTLPVELRISDRRSWEESEKRGDAHHDAYKFRQRLFLMNRLFSPYFDFPKEALGRLREDQGLLFR